MGLECGCQSVILHFVRLFSRRRVQGHFTISQSQQLLPLKVKLSAPSRKLVFVLPLEDCRYKDGYHLETGFVRGRL